MTAEEFNPVLLHMQHQSYCMHFEEAGPFPERITRWHEMDIITYGHGRDIVSHEEYQVETGDVFYRTDGMYNQHYRPYYCYFFVFDPCYTPAHAPRYAGSASELIGENNLDEPLNTRWEPIPPFSFSRGPKLGKMKDIEPVLRLAVELQRVWDKAPRDPYTVKCLFMNLLLEIREQLVNAPPPANIPRQFLQYAPQIEDLMAYIRRNPNVEYSIRSLAGRVRLSDNFFLRVFSTIAGETPMEYVRRVKLNQIKTLLLDTELTVAEIARECSVDENYLYVLFKRTTGLTPIAFRKGAAPRGSWGNN